MRTSEIERNTSETKINLKINLDGTGKTISNTGLPFLDHMIDQIGKHGLIDIDLKAEGDLHIDDHHTIEDIGISFGEALKEAIGDKKGIRRYGFSYVPLDEALSRVVLDFSGRPGLFLDANFVKDKAGDFAKNQGMKVVKNVAGPAAAGLAVSKGVDSLMKMGKKKH